MCLIIRIIYSKKGFCASTTACVASVGSNTAAVCEVVA